MREWFARDIAKCFLSILALALCSLFETADCVFAVLLFKNYQKKKRIVAQVIR
jgi:hypothetical protein